MPLIILTGYPCSSKTTRAIQLHSYFSDRSSSCKKIVVINDTDCSDLEETYTNSRLEKNQRASLKSQVQKHLNKDTLVILDALNYIKGYRYELYCVAKSSSSTHCVIWCDISRARSHELNNARSADRQYPPGVLDELIQRYEPPDSNKRWDSPLFITQIGDELPLESIDAALYRSEPPAPNLSTVAQPLQPTNFMYELESVASDTTKFIMSAQKTSVPGDRIKTPGGGEICLSRHLTMAELNKIKRQFISYMKMNPVSDTSKLSAIFTQYLQSSI